VNREDLQAIARVRLREAIALLEAGLPDGAYYLAGYAVECALKACIAKRTKRYDFPDKTRVNSSYSHNLKELARVADLEGGLKDRSAKDEEFRKSWDAVQVPIGRHPR
jgi:HEPN domain-containing protein